MLEAVANCRNDGPRSGRDRQIMAAVVTEPIELRFEAACSPEHAFDTWANWT